MAGNFKCDPVMGARAPRSRRRSGISLCERWKPRLEAKRFKLSTDHLDAGQKPRAAMNSEAALGDHSSTRGASSLSASIGAARPRVVLCPPTVRDPSTELTLGIANVRFDQVRATRLREAVRAVVTEVSTIRAVKKSASSADSRRISDVAGVDATLGYPVTNCQAPRRADTTSAAARQRRRATQDREPADDQGERARLH